MKKSLHNNLIQAVSAIVTFVSRLGSLPANVSPLGSFGFFSSNLLLFFVIILSFDFFIKGFYPGFWLTYIGFAAYPLLGRLSKHKVSQQLIALPTASFLFFLISNFGVWLYWYDHSLQNLLLCYTLALPFYQRTLFGDIVFGYGYILIRFLLKNSSLVRNMVVVSRSKDIKSNQSDSILISSL